MSGGLIRAAVIFFSEKKDLGKLSFRGLVTKEINVSLFSFFQVKCEETNSGDSNRREDDYERREFKEKGTKGAMKV